MGEARRDALRVGFDHAIKLEFHGAKVSSDAGLYRAILERIRRFAALSPRAAPI